MILHRKNETGYFFKIIFLCHLFLYSHSIFALQLIEHDTSFYVVNDLQFSKVDKQLTLDLFIPNNLSHPTPCIMVIQGGGFKSQDGQRFRFIAEYIAENDYVAALISYRGRPDYTYKTTMEDVKTALKYIRQKSSVYSIDPNKIGAMGRSAGGAIAALLAVTGDDSVFNTKRHDTSSKIKAAVAYAGVFDFIARFSDSRQIALQPKIDQKIIDNGEWIGTSFSAKNNHWKNASAIHHVDKNDAPILFVHCKDDQTVPWYQSQAMYEKMKDSGINSEILYFEVGGHGFHLENKDIWLSPMILFFKNQFE